MVAYQQALQHHGVVDAKYRAFIEKEQVVQSQLDGLLKQEEIFTGIARVAGAPFFSNKRNSFHQPASKQFFKSFETSACPSSSSWRKHISASLP